MVHSRMIAKVMVVLLLAGLAYSPALLFSESLTLIALDGLPVTIIRDEFGVPHISGESETGVFYGQGFAVAHDRLFQMERLRRASEGKLSEWYGSFYLNFDKNIRTVFYTEGERMQLYKNLPEEMQQMIAAYSDGINTYLDSMEVNPKKYKPYEFQTLEMERWSIVKSIAVMHYMIRNFGQFGGSELSRLGELQLHGQEWLDTYKPINDPNAPTTITDGSAAVAKTWRYSGMRVQPDIIQSIESRQREFTETAQALQLPLKLGSFAVLVSPARSMTGNVMLLGCPQMGEPRKTEPQITNEVELHCPSLHVGGMTVAGIPSVIIGHTERHAWSLTSGISDNCDVYIDSTLTNSSDLSSNKYFFDGNWLEFETIRDTIPTQNSEIVFEHYRSLHGPVIGYDLANNQVFTMKMTFWNKELDMIKFVLGVIKANSLEEFEAAAAINPMSFNLVYAGNDQQIKYWHTGLYQDRSDSVDPRLPHKGDGSEEWGGFIDFKDLPNAAAPVQSYFVNWNNKPVSWWNNGDNIAWVGSHRVTAMSDFVDPLAQPSYDDLKAVPRIINSHGTYQQAIEFCPTEIIDENIVPPGQSGFINLDGQPDPHFSDQWSLHTNWEFKDMIFNQSPSGVAGDESLPSAFQLSQNYPNPFNPVTTITYSLPGHTDVSLKVCNIRGQVVEILVDEMQPSGNYRVKWHAEGFGSGIYFYRLKADGFSAVRRCVYLK
ncbi:penicillin acylase family protein [candidate division KSB1 bacterium]|nr:penicillin acylase family protein [candidate division KSB1 bacterium]